ncbi:hypothetical protein CSW44_04375, partial [Thermus scotoductus]
RPLRATTRATSKAASRPSAGVYHLLYWRKQRKGIYPIPFGAIFGYLALLLLAPAEGRLAALLVALVVALRGLQILSGRW